MPTRATVTPKVIQQMVWAGSNLSSYEMAAEAIHQLSGNNLSAGRIRRQVEQVGQARVLEREQRVEELRSLPLPERRSAKQHEPAPEIAVVMMDGGRYQRRDHFRSAGGKSNSPSDAKTHWRESKVGCLLSMSGKVHSEDPCAKIPESFAHASAVREIAKMAGNTEPNASLGTPDKPHVRKHVKTAIKPVADDYQAPQLVTRDVVASGRDSQDFGWQLEALARRLNFNGADRQAFVADGAKVNWRIQQEHFPRATPIADLIHALAYAWSAAQIDTPEATYSKWAQLIWQGDVAHVIEHLKTLLQVHGHPPDNSPSDLRHHVARAMTYFSNNSAHMDYPRYRQQGLPITSAHIESTVKQINRRIKGTEKFWCQPASETVLQLRGDYLSQSRPMETFWTRYFANQDGANRYNTDSTIAQSA